MYGTMLLPCELNTVITHAGIIKSSPSVTPDSVNEYLDWYVISIGYVLV